MARQIPEVVRAAAGLAATVLDEARKLPETLPGLPVRVIGLAMQQSLRFQQQYAGLVARGDELLVGLRGADEPGLATFDDDVDLVDEAPAAEATGYRESAFDRADLPIAEPAPADDTPEETPAPAAERAEKPARAKKGKGTRSGGKGSRKSRTNVEEAAEAAEVAGLPADPAADDVVAAVEDVAAQVDGAQEALDELPGQAPSTEEVLEELAIDEMVGDDVPGGAPGAGTQDDGAGGTSTDETPDVATTVDVLTPAGEVATVEAAVTDEGVAAPEGTDSPAPDTAVDESGTPVAAATGPAADAGSEDSTDDGSGDSTDAGPAASPDDSADAAAASAEAPIEGYDGFSIAQLRGRLRGYALSTVADLLSYEEATRAREPYLRMLRNRLERLEAQAVEASPLAPRGA